MADEDTAVLQQVFRDAPVPIAIYALDGELQRQNDAHEAFTAALGGACGIGNYNPLLDLRAEREGHRAHFQRAAAGEVVDYAFTVRPEPTADVLHFHRLLMPTSDASGRNTHVVSVIVEVSDWLHAERDKARLQAELQQAQRTEALGLLAGSIAHDFNNLLVGVLGNASLLLEALDAGSSLASVAEAIELSARRAAEVARQLLAYAGKGQFQVEELDLSELAREISELLRITIAQRAELRLELASPIASVKADATQMRQVVMNLITNAGDAMAGPGHITLRTGELPVHLVDFAAYIGNPDPEATRFVFLEIEDTGAGMDVETAARIFDPFFTTKPTGRGLGLSAVLGIIRSHAGALSVASAPGRGTTVRILLPAHGRPASAAKTAAAAPAAQAPRQAHLLIVDDQQPVRVVLEAMLKRLGYAVTSVANAREVMRVLEREAISGVMLDLTMPEQDGSETFARIRERHPQLPVIFMSGYEARSVPAADSFLHKPFTMSQLRQVLSEALGGDGRAKG